MYIYQYHFYQIQSKFLIILQEDQLILTSLNHALSRLYHALFFQLKTEFKDRKIKHDIKDLKRDLGWLRLTNPPAILIETCFVSNKSDTDKYISNREKIAKLIAEGIANQTVSENNNSSTSSTNKKLYAVCIGAYSDKSVADSKVEELKKKGYKDTYLIPRQFILLIIYGKILLK